MLNLSRTQVFMVSTSATIIRIFIIKCYVSFISTETTGRYFYLSMGSQYTIEGKFIHINFILIRTNCYINVLRRRIHFTSPILV